ncbi:MAG: hypothetical protein A2Y07_01900 [Planctomycetes bacterium GWF2_50_10]|nr:MAG: hypothetical protein A2Y07_01900 [Planctomycetes bacterium GWF2_50_10]
MDLGLTYERAAEILKKHNQSHLLSFWDELSAGQQAGLLGQIASLDFAQLDNWVKTYVVNAGGPVIPANFGPAPYYPASPRPGQEELYQKAREKGVELLKAGKVAAFVVAGGQGTRLGYDGPKGNYPVSPVKKKTLFTLFGEQILAASRRYGRGLSWYVMTSPLNHEATVEIFEKAGFFGLGRENIFIFQQGTMPNFAFDGKILMADKGSLALSPDGHGGSLKALYQSGAVADMAVKGIEQISYFQVDNPLINIFDPLFIGFHAMDGAGMSSKALKKTGPLEKVGNFCLVDGKVNVIEYSDLPDEMAEKTKADGSLVFELGSIAIHIISREFIESLNKGGFALPFHRAVKKIPYIDWAGKLVEPKGPNGVKLETFVFDALNFASKSVILETIREQEFGPVKNATGVDSAQSSRVMQVERAAGWLEAAGVKVPRSGAGVDAQIEISPMFALDKEEVLAKRGMIGDISARSEVYLG